MERRESFYTLPFSCQIESQIKELYRNWKKESEYRLMQRIILCLSFSYRIELQAKGLDEVWKVENGDLSRL